MLKNLGWVILVIFVIFMAVFIYVSYLPLKRELADVRGELAMWEEMVKKKGKHLKTWQFNPDEFFEGTKIAPKGEVMLARIFDSLKVFSKEKTLSFTATGGKKDILLWLDRLDFAMRFVVKNCSLAVTNYRIEFERGKMDDFGVHIDD